MKKKIRYPSKKRRKNKNIAGVIAAAAAVVLAVSGGAVVLGMADSRSESTLAPIAEVSITSAASETTAETEPLPEVTLPEEPDRTAFRKPYRSERTREFSDSVTAANAILIDAETGEVLGRKSSLQKIYPASMTKVISLLVAAEHLSENDMDKTYPMTYEMLAPLVADNASRAGFEIDEAPTVRDMLYGLILPSGADAAVGLAEYIAGSEEAFAELMNEKAAELGLEETHFENPTGLHSKTHYTTCAEMAVIMKAAMDNDLCREVLSTYTYTTSPTEQHPEGIPLVSTVFSRMYGTEVEDVTITAGKTGYTDQAGQCLVTYAEKDGKHYICVIAGDYEKYAAVYSTFEAYGNYLP